jgi:fibro-slime domain-containing protein
MKNVALRVIAFFLLITGLFSTNALSQIYPDTIYVPVTYFDFHSDGSCPEFNPVVDNDNPVLNMVQNDLDSDSLPVRGTKIFYSYYLENWFRSSENGEQTVTDKLPVYDYWGNFQSETTVTYNPYENRKFTDSLAFWHIGDGVTIPMGTYEYSDTAFFPLDNMGFGNEDTYIWTGAYTVNDHNYGFTMMLKKEFIFKDSMSFNFSGDDDVWVYINNKQALDLGGIHMEVQGSFDLDNLANQLGLILGERYFLSLFFAERQATSSHIRITTNIIAAPPDSLHISVEPNDTIQVGDTLTGIAAMFTDTGAVSIDELDGDMNWYFYDINGFNHDSTFIIVNDSTVQFIPTDAYTTIIIIVVYTDTASNITVTDSVEIVVLPGPPDHLVLEASPNMPALTDPFLRDDHPLDTVYILTHETMNEQFYAILRDKHGNWIGPANREGCSCNRNSERSYHCGRRL